MNNSLVNCQDGLSVSNIFYNTFSIGMSLVGLVGGVAYRCFKNYVSEREKIPFPAKLIEPNKHEINLLTPRATRRVCLDPDYAQEIDELEHYLYESDQEVRQILVNNYSKAQTQKEEQPVEIFINKNLKDKVKIENLIDTVVASSRGGRTYMEDAYLVDKQFTGVFDGHGIYQLSKTTISPGAEAALFVRDHLVVNFKKWLHRFGKTDIAICNAFRRSFLETGRKYDGLGGTTANLVWQNENTLWCANTGDTRAILVLRSGLVQLSCDAKLEEDDFANEVLERGGKIRNDKHGVLRIDDCLAVAAALGDHLLKGHVPSIPNIVKWTITEPALLIQASDGLWGFLTAQKVADYARKLLQNSKSLEQIALDFALVPLSNPEDGKDCDNITIVVKEILPQACHNG